MIRKDIFDLLKKQGYFPDLDTNTEADLMGADSSEVDLSEVDLRGANLRNADLRNANLNGVVLNDADLRWTNLNDANLRWADLRGANLNGADLRKADLRGADLRNANLSWADLNGVVLNDANLNGANLSGAKGILSQTEWLKINTKKYRGFIIAYKIESFYYDKPKNWKYEEKAILVENCSFSRTSNCACGVNVATLEWCKKEKESNKPIWECLVDPAGVCVPYNTNGKFRAEWVKLIKIVNL